MKAGVGPALTSDVLAAQGRCALDADETRVGEEERVF
jgi:hypothetical protein